MTENIPTEAVKPGNAFQIINVHHPVTGEFVRQLRARGTELQVRARAEQGFYHPTEDSEHWTFLRAIIVGELPGTREELLAHIDAHEPCAMDDDLRSVLPQTTDRQLAEHVWAAHLWIAHTSK